MTILGINCSTKVLKFSFFCGMQKVTQKEYIMINDLLWIQMYSVSLLLTWRCWRSSPQCGIWGQDGPWRGRSSVSQCSSKTPRLASHTWWRDRDPPYTQRLTHLSYWDLIPEMSQVWFQHRQRSQFAIKLYLLKAPHVVLHLFEIVFSSIPKTFRSIIMWQ